MQTLYFKVERRFTSRLSDMRDRLDQANTTTRSMQNYVSFLKSSYSTVFDDMDDGRWPHQLINCDP